MLSTRGQADVNLHRPYRGGVRRFVELRAEERHGVIQVVAHRVVGARAIVRNNHQVLFQVGKSKLFALSLLDCLETLWTNSGALSFKNPGGVVVLHLCTTLTVSDAHSVSNCSTYAHVRSYRVVVRGSPLCSGAISDKQGVQVESTVTSF